MPSALLVGAGLALSGVALGWRLIAARRWRARLREMLWHPDASVRAAGMRRIAATGLAPWTSLLLERVADPTDTQVAGELAWLIASCQWEPADDPRVMQLRLWAAEHHRAAEARPQGLPTAEPGARRLLAPADRSDTIPPQLDPDDEIVPAAEISECRLAPAALSRLAEAIGEPVDWASFVPAATSGSFGSTTSSMTTKPLTV